MVKKKFINNLYLNIIILYFYFEFHFPTPLSTGLYRILIIIIKEDTNALLVKLINEMLHGLAAFHIKQSHCYSIKEERKNTSLLLMKK